MRPEQTPQTSEEIPYKLWESFGVQPGEGVAQVVDAISAHVETYSGFVDARLEPWAGRMILHAIRNDAEFCAAFDGLESSRDLVNQRLRDGLTRLRELPLGHNQLVATNQQLFGATVAAMTAMNPDSPQRKYLRACAAEFGYNQILGEKLQLIQQQQLACAQQARTRTVRGSNRAAAQERGQAMEECLNIMGFSSEITIGKTQSYQLYETGRRVVYRSAAAAALSGLGVTVGAIPGGARDMPVPVPVAVEQAESGVPKAISLPPDRAQQPAPRPVAVPQATLQEAPEETKPVQPAPRRKPVPVVPVQVKETTIQERTPRSAPIRAEVPDDTPEVKQGETPGQALARVVRLGNVSSAAKLILEQTGNGAPNKPINKKLDQLIVGAQTSWRDDIKAGGHRNSYEDRAILSLSFLHAAIKNPAVLESGAGKALLASITKQHEDPYREQLADASRARAKDLLLSRENGKLRGYDKATQQAIIELYSYTQLATISEAKQVARMADMKAANDAERKPGDYSQQAVDAGEAKGRAYDRKIGDIIASIPNRTDAQRQFMHDMITNIDVLRREDPQTNLEVMMAQAIHESAWGTRTIKDSNNLFGVKAGDSWTGKTVEAVGWEVIDGQRVEYSMTWRAYDSYTDSIRDHAKLIESQPWFQDAVAHKDDPSAYLDGLLNPDEPAYATDPNYKSYVLQIIDANRIGEMIGLLTERDRAIQDERDRARAAQEQAAKERQRQEQQERQEQQSGMSNGQEILNYLSKKYGGVSGKLSSSELATFDAPYTNGGTIRMSLQHEAAKQFQELDKAYKAKFGVSMVVTDHYRDYEAQVRLYNGGKNPLAAPSGTSNHGWGLAVDMGDAVGGNYDTEKYQWMAANAPKYGWINPGWAKPGDEYRKSEPWHWEYLGSVALENPDTWLEM